MAIGHEYEITPEVLRAIHYERVFQNRKWGTIKEHGHEVGAWITIIRKLTMDAEYAWTSRQGDMAALDEVRKIAAVAIACMEQHPVIHRSPMSFATGLQH